MSTKTYIICRFQFEGHHHWKNAPLEVDFLRVEHRHIFHVEVRLPVMHNDRDLEFITVKKFLENAVLDMYELNLGGKSCEMICEDIHKVIQDKYGFKKDVTVSVFEDAENGAMVAT